MLGMGCYLQQALVLLLNGHFALYQRQTRVIKHLLLSQATNPFGACFCSVPPDCDSLNILPARLPVLQKPNTGFVG
jgi:hypothetical protein